MLGIDKKTAFYYIKMFNYTVYDLPWITAVESMFDLQIYKNQCHVSFYYKVRQALLQTDSFDVLQSRTISTADADGADFLFYKLRQGEL